jgi:uncharacterized protein YlaI
MNREKRRRLLVVLNMTRPAFVTHCAECGKRIDTATEAAAGRKLFHDPKGRPFEAYYCESCSH